jgi:hypothetical protein
VQNKTPEIMRGINKFFTDPKWSIVIWLWLAGRNVALLLVIVVVKCKTKFKHSIIRRVSHYLVLKVPCIAWWIAIYVRWLIAWKYLFQIGECSCLVIVQISLVAWRYCKHLDIAAGIVNCVLVFHYLRHSLAHLLAILIGK